MTIGNGISFPNGLANAGVYQLRPLSTQSPAERTHFATKPADSIRLSSAASPVVSPTYGTTGLQATSPGAALESIGKLVAGRVSPKIDFTPGRGVARDGALPFYTNPALANGVATSTNVARLGLNLDASG